MNRTLAAGISFLTLAAGALMVGRLPAQNSNADDDHSESIIRRGFEIAPVPLNLTGRNRAQVGLGSYLVNAVSGCNDCHTCPSYQGSNNPYHGQPGAVNVASYLAGGVPFGPFTSRNITPQPDEGNLPAGLTLDQFRLVLRTGVDPDHVHPQISPLLQVMPWPVFRNMTNRDIDAIYEYLSAIPHADTPPPGTCSGAGQ